MVAAIALTSVIIVLVIIVVLLLMVNHDIKDSLRKEYKLLHDEQKAKGLLIEILSEHGEGKCVQTPKLK